MLDICVLRLGVKEQRWLGDDKLAAYRHSHQIFKAPNILAAGWFGITLFQTFSHNWRGIISRSLSFILNEVSNLVIALRVWILHFHTIKTNQMSCRFHGSSANEAVRLVRIQKVMERSRNHEKLLFWNYKSQAFITHLFHHFVHNIHSSWITSVVLNIASPTHLSKHLTSPWTADWTNSSSGVSKTQKPQGSQ